MTSNTTPTTEESNKIILGDCLEIMRGFEDEIIDLTVTSPPYDDLRTYGGYVFDFEPIARELYRVTKDGGVVVWVIGDQTINGSETGTSFSNALYFKKIGFNLHDTMIWRKPNAMPNIATNRYTPAFEYMFVFSKGIPKTVNRILESTKYGGKVIQTNTSNPESIMNYKGRKATKPTKPLQNVWDIKVFGTNFGHPAVFPIKLAEDHIKSWSNEGDMIFDPFCGSGTTLKAAKDLSREYIGIEISPEYVRIAKDRLKQEVLL